MKAIQFARFGGSPDVLEAVDIDIPAPQRAEGASRRPIRAGRRGAGASRARQSPRAGQAGAGALIAAGNAMNVLIVHAHHEPSSFNATLLRAAVSALREHGHEVEVSDLYAMRFDPVSDRRNFESMFDPARLRQQAEEAHASAGGGFAAELRAEMAKLARCDLLILHFPIWWLGMPAILKGWVDRVFAVGVAYGGGRAFATGAMRGKRAMCIVTTGGLAHDYDGSGNYAPIEQVLYPIHRGIFEFTGFDVLPPFVAYGPNRVAPAERAASVDALRERIARLGGSTRAAHAASWAAAALGQPQPSPT
jgi:NAD(P)H dehydrogenase (quinone)